MVKKLFVVVAYDVTINKNRTRVAKLLEQVGQRKNKSVFECLISPAEFLKLQTKISKRIDSKTDIVLYYSLCKDCRTKAIQHGNNIDDYQIVINI